MMDRNRRLKNGMLALAGALLVAACTSRSWKQEPGVQAARRACKGLGDAGWYACVERQAVETLDPDVCRLAGIWIDDMCLQAVFEAAGDPAICDRLYLKGVRPLCKSYYAQRSIEWRQYADPALGFAVLVPRGWAVGEAEESQDPLGRDWTAIEFTGGLRPYGSQAFAVYGFRLEVGPTASSTLSEAAELSLSPLDPVFRQPVQILCCRIVGGEEALELLHFPPTRWGNRRMIVLHEGWEYHLDFHPLAGLTTSTPSGGEAQVAFDTFVRTFAFLPITETPLLPAPLVTPVPA